MSGTRRTRRTQAVFGKRGATTLLIGTLVALFAVSVAPASAAVNIFTAAQSGTPGIESSMSFFPAAGADLLAQLENQQGSDADSTTYSQAFSPAADGTVDTITWWGTGAAQTGFMVALHDGVWPTATSGTLPDGPAVYGTLANLSVLPIAQVTQTPSISGETQYQIHIPATAVLASHSYRLSVTAVGGSFQWDRSAAGGTGAVNWVRGRLQSYLSTQNVSFSLDSLSGPPAITAPPVNTSVTVLRPYSFSATASGYPVPSLQWQRSNTNGLTWSNIVGATASPYSARAALADDGALFRAVFTNSAGTVTSSAARLTVTSPTTVVLTSSVAVPVFGQTTTLTAAVASPLAPTTPLGIGSVSFFDGPARIGTIPVTGGKALLSVSNLRVGLHSIRAVYSGAGFVLPARSALLSLRIAKAATSVALTGPASLKAGLAAPFTATVNTTLPGAGLATGTVTFRDGITVIGTLPLSLAAKATFTTTTLRVGIHTITAIYGGDASHLPSKAARLIRIT